MPAEAPHPRDTLFDRVLTEAIAEKGLKPGEYALFDTTVEGKFLPIGTGDDPVEEYSGNLVTRDGQHFFFWLGWDHQADKPTLIYWHPVQFDKEWFDDAEYLAARKEVGLPA